MAFNEVFSAVLTLVTAENPTKETTLPISIQRVYFIDSPGGCGKTFVTRTIQQFPLMRRKNVRTVATSAVKLTPCLSVVQQLRIQGGITPNFNDLNYLGIINHLNVSSTTPTSVTEAPLSHTQTHHSKNRTILRFHITELDPIYHAYPDQRASPKPIQQRWTFYFSSLRVSSNHQLGGSNVYLCA